MDPGVIGVLIPIIIPLGIFVMVVFIRKYENEEKLAMIDKGMNPNEHQPKRLASMGALRFALLIIGAGIGLLIGNFLYEVTRMEETVAYFSMLFIFGGLGLVASYIAEQKQIKKDAQ